MMWLWNMLIFSQIQLATLSCILLLSRPHKSLGHVLSSRVKSYRQFNYHCFFLWLSPLNSIFQLPLLFVLHLTTVPAIFHDSHSFMLSSMCARVHNGLHFHLWSCSQSMHDTRQKDPCLVRPDYWRPRGTQNVSKPHYIASIFQLRCFIDHCSLHDPTRLVHFTSCLCFIVRLE